MIQPLNAQNIREGIIAIISCDETGPASPSTREIDGARIFVCHFLSQVRRADVHKVGRGASAALALHRGFRRGATEQCRDNRHPSDRCAILTDYFAQASLVAVLEYDIIHLK